MDSGVNGSRQLFGITMWECLNSEYCFNCHGCNNIFGCVGLRKKNYCIFNKQYSKEDYEKLRVKMIEHMEKMQFIDKVGRVYKYGEYLDGYIPAKESKVKPFRDMDFLKPGKKIGVEVQFGKYAFMVYNVCAKMTIFKNLGVINAGIEIVPVKNFADEMSTGVSYFEQFAWDLNHRGISNIDIPVLILGIDS